MPFHITKANSVLAANGSAFGNTTAPSGTQVAFLQNVATITQTVNFASPGSSGRSTADTASQSDASAGGHGARSGASSTSTDW